MTPIVQRILMYAGGVTTAALLALVIVVTLQRDAARAELGQAKGAATAAAAQRDAEARALADEKIATTAAVNAAKTCNDTATTERDRAIAARAADAAALERARTSLAKCQTPEALQDRLGRLFP